MTVPLMATAATFEDEGDSQPVPVLPRGTKCVDEVDAESKAAASGAITRYPPLLQQEFNTLTKSE